MRLRIKCVDLSHDLFIKAGNEIWFIIPALTVSHSIAVRVGELVSAQVSSVVFISRIAAHNC